MIVMVYRDSTGNSTKIKHDYGSNNTELEKSQTRIRRLVV